MAGRSRELARILLLVLQMLMNEQVARRIEEVADLLSEQGTNPYRTRAYRRGAATVARLSTPVSEILRREGIEGLRKLPGIGDHLATDQGADPGSPGQDR